MAILTMEGPACAESELKGVHIVSLAEVEGETSYIWKVVFLR